MIRVCGARLVAALAAGGPASADDLAVWRHGTLIPKSDAGFIYMAAEGGVAKKQDLDLNQNH